MEDWFYDHPVWSTILLLLTIFIVLFAVMVPMALTLSKKTCYSMYENYNPQWGVWSECRIVWDGKLTPVDMVKRIDVLK